MDALGLPVIAAKIIETLLAPIVKVGSEEGLAQIKRLRQSRKSLDDHLSKTLNYVSFLTTYRGTRQLIDDAYVEPLLADRAISQEYLPPVEIEKIEAFLNATPNQQKSDRAATSRFGPLSTSVTLPKINFLTFETIAQQITQLIILAQPGSGKSTFLSYLCRRRLQFSTPRLPVLLNARLLSKQSILSVTRELISKLGLPDGHMASWMNTGIAFYIDGLDEVEESRFKALCVEIRDLLQESPLIELSVSCRSAAYRDELSCLKAVSIFPFDLERTEKFVARWFKDVDVERGESMIAKIRQSAHLRQLSSQPLLLILMCNAYFRNLDITRRQTAVFDQCLDALLWQWDADRGFRRTTTFDGLDFEKRKWLLSKVAVALHQSRLRFIDERAILTTLENIIPDYGMRPVEARALLLELCSHHGILISWSKDTYAFGHFALQEYLVGKWYSNEQRWTALLSLEHLRDPWWENVFALALASLSDATAAMMKVWTLQNASEIERVRVIGVCLKLDPILSRDYRDYLLQRILRLYHNGNPDEHDMALVALVAMEDMESVKKITRSFAGVLPSAELVRKILRRPV